MKRVLTLTIIMIVCNHWVTLGQKSLVLTYLEGYSLSTAHLKDQKKFTPVRFTPPISNAGLLFYTHKGQHHGTVNSLGLKNIGFIHPTSDSTKTKYRIYALSSSIAYRFQPQIASSSSSKGDLLFSHAYVGIGLDVAFNFTERFYQANSKKERISYFFSKRTRLLHPSIIAGFRSGTGLHIKAQYYPLPLLNTQYTDGAVQPYKNLHSQLINISFGWDLMYVLYNLRLYNTYK